MSEQDTALKFIECFSDFPIYKEVPVPGGIVDFVVDMGATKIAVEVKERFGLNVVAQAISRKPYFHYVYVATPNHKRPHELLLSLLKSNGIGWIYTDFDGRGTFRGSNYIIERLKPSLNRYAKLPQLHEYMFQSVAGSVSERVTSFGHFVNEVTAAVRAARTYGIAPDDLFKMTYKHYKTLSIFKRNMFVWIKNNVIKNVEYRDKRFYYVMSKTENL